MGYGIFKQLLLYKEFDTRILIENKFKETTRNGNRVLGRVYLALSPTTFIIGPEDILKYFASYTHEPYNPLFQKLITFHPLESISLTIFKKSKRQSIKINFEGKVIRYFELESNTKKTFWKLWNLYVFELNNTKTIWPFIKQSKEINKMSVSNYDEVSIMKYNLRWTDKYLYLGQQREIEDKNRPVPIPGLISAEFSKLINLKSQYFGCWSQSDH